MISSFANLAAVERCVLAEPPNPLSGIKQARVGAAAAGAASAAGQSSQLDTGVISKRATHLYAVGLSLVGCTQYSPTILPSISNRPIQKSGPMELSPPAGMKNEIRLLFAQ
jgi:hypothetical protein